MVVVEMGGVTVVVVEVGGDGGGAWCMVEGGDGGDGEVGGDGGGVCLRVVMVRWEVTVVVRGQWW